MEDSQFTLLRRFQYTSEALILQGKLESQGIPVFLRDHHTIDSNPLYSNAVGGVKLFVNTEDVERATSILNEIQLYAVDDDDQLIKCPNCGAPQVSLEIAVDGVKSLFRVVVLGIFALLFTKHKYQCAVCKHEFNTP
jgi:DNA-directed RNA polymerase subunit RPC12/RpoP